jgi:putative transposase
MVFHSVRARARRRHSSMCVPVTQAVIARFGGIEADAARGVTVRADNGPHYISRHFTRQIAHWGMALSHSFHTAAEVRAAVATFVTRYNASWHLARLGYMSPLDYRRRHAAAPALQMAA